MMVRTAARGHLGERKFTANPILPPPEPLKSAFPTLVWWTVALTTAGVGILVWTWI